MPFKKKNKRKASDLQKPTNRTPKITEARKAPSTTKGSLGRTKSIKKEHDRDGSDKRVYRSQIVIDGETFRVGDSVYVVLDEDMISHVDSIDKDVDDAFICPGCGSDDEKSSPLVECSRCLCGHHLSCLDPPLDAIPEGSWVCPNCALGKAPRKRSITSAREHFLQRSGLGLAHIDAIWTMQSTKQSWFSARWYYLPEETHAGRQSHHAGREIFSSRAHDECEVNTILRTAKVISMHEYYHGGDIGDDIFVCDYEYDHMWQRFRRHAWDDFAAEEDTSSSDDENGDATYTAMDALRAERGEDFGRRRRHGRRLKRQQGGFDFGAQLGARVIPAHVRAEGPQSLKQACHALTLTVTPQSLPCRENENASVKQFVEKVLATDGGAGKCLYVSGIPGTGKTATVLEVMRNLRRRSEVGELPHFHFVEINGLRLPTPQHAYSQLYEALTGECMGPSTAAAALDDLFAGKPRHGIMRTKYHTIVMLDEMDSLVNKTQNVLYNLFDWPSRASSRLSIIGIANTMDLPERLHPRIGSRLAGCRIVFHPYQRDQLETIMHSRLEGCSAFERGAITFVARKVANCSGDVRRCLELCRRAAEIAAKRQQNTDGNPEDEVTVKMKDVDSAIREAFSTPHIKMVRDSSTLELLLLCAIVLESRYTGQCEVYLDNAASRLSTLGNTTIPPFSALLQCAVGLAARKVVLCDAGHKRLKAKLALNVPVDDISYVLSNDPDLSWLAERLK